MQISYIALQRITIMYKSILTSLLLISTFYYTNAQVSIQATAQYGIPLTEYSGDIKSGIGANLKVGFWIDDHLRLNVGSGYYMGKFESIKIDGVNQPVTDANLSIIPVTVGAEFYFLGTTADKEPSKIKPFFALDLGYALVMQSASVVAQAKNRNSIIFGPSFGVAYELSENLDVLASLRNNILLYEYKDIVKYMETYQLLGINLGVNYRF
jgi:hypothetical protein